MLHYVLDTAQKLKPTKTVVVIGHQGDVVQKTFEEKAKVQWVRQKKMRGTGDAVASASSVLSKENGDVLVLYGDIPSIRIETLRRLFMLHRSSSMPLRY